MKQSPFSEMDGKLNRVAYLVAGFIRQDLTKKEHIELDGWINTSDENMQLFEELTDEKNIAANLEWMDGVNTEKTYEALKERGAFDLPKKRYSRRLWMAAASVVVLLALFYWLKETRPKPAFNKDLVSADTTLLKPGTDRALLTLADGKTIDLTDDKTGLIEGEAGMKLRTTGDGVLLYESVGTTGSTARFHTLSTTVGGQYQLRLPDGTKVGLNAASSLRYPLAFANNERRVMLTGEAYFEVAKDASHPFKVLLADSSTVLVTGTHFNVQAYENEQQQQVSLLEGGVTVGRGGSMVKLEPGTEALLLARGILKRRLQHPAEVTGWKDGLFVFRDAPIEAIMLQLQRWYGATIIYKAKSPQLFNASIARKEPLPKLLKLLELNGYVHFKTVKDTIYVLP